MKRIFVCSPYSGEVRTNVKLAKELCVRVISAGHAPFAPHLFYPQFLDDKIKQDRDFGLACGKRFLSACDEVWVYTGRGISSGMVEEIKYAIYIGVPVLKFQELDYAAKIS